MKRHMKTLAFWLTLASLVSFWSILAYLPSLAAPAEPKMSAAQQPTPPESPPKGHENIPKWHAALISVTVPATPEDLYMPGTQPETLTDTIIPVGDCAYCHSNYGQEEAEPFRNWQGSMMAQSARDPVFWAALAIANQDVEGSGTFCLRCHTPKAWLEGRAAPDGSQLINADFQGVSCNFCHRLVDPNYQEGISPARDEAIITALGEAVPFYSGGMYVVDPEDERRGPWELRNEGWYVEDCWPEEACMNNNPHRPLEWPIESDFHRQSALCGTCHDVINPLYTGSPEEGYTLDPLGQPLEDMSTAFPVERTYTEWRLSQYATDEGVYAPQFNPNLPDGIIHTCQDCHMPSAANASAAQNRRNWDCRIGGADGELCPDMVEHDLVPVHDLTGGNTWVPETIKIHPEFGSQVNADALDAGIERSRALLQKSATLETTVEANTLHVRIINETGHKLPTGYAEGRQMWLAITAYDAQNQIVYQSGAYDDATAELTYDADLQWFGIKQAIGEEWASELGIEAGESFHFLLNNEIELDNRIPPRGFTNDAFAQYGAAPVGATYADGQYWADVSYDLPDTTINVMVELKFQTASREYIEFLRDANTSNDAGELLYELWEQTDRSPPEVLASADVCLHCLYLPLTIGR